MIPIAGTNRLGPQQHGYEIQVEETNAGGKRALSIVHAVMHNTAGEPIVPPRNSSDETAERPYHWRHGTGTIADVSQCSEVELVISWSYRYPALTVPYEQGGREGAGAGRTANRVMAMPPCCMVRVCDKMHGQPRCRLTRGNHGARGSLHHQPSSPCPKP